MLILSGRDRKTKPGVIPTTFLPAVQEGSGKLRGVAPCSPIRFHCRVRLRLRREFLSKGQLEHCKKDQPSSCVLYGYRVHIDLQDHVQSSCWVCFTSLGMPVTRVRPST